MKSKVFEYFDSSPKEKKERVKKSSEFQLGQYVGYYIYHVYLPTLSSDMIQSRNVIKVTDEEFGINRKLNIDSFMDYLDKKEYDISFRLYLNNLNELKRKYLPEVLECWFLPLDISDETEFKEGLINALWNTDLCHYSLNSDDITIVDDTHEDMLLSTSIKLKLTFK